MGHSTHLQCPSCNEVQEVDLKDIFPSDDSENVTFTFSCKCGYVQEFLDTPLEQIAPLVSNRPEPHIADFLGISRESYESYVWPPNVRKTIDKQRRDLPDSATKRLLRSSALELPKQFDDRWWIVYAVSPQIVFDPKSNKYGFIGSDGQVNLVGDIFAVESLLSVQT